MFVSQTQIFVADGERRNCVGKREKKGHLTPTAKCRLVGKIYHFVGMWDKIG